MKRFWAGVSGPSFRGQRKLTNGRGLVALAVICLLAVVTGLPKTASAQIKVDAKLPEYKSSTGVSGTLKSVGSDTMNNLMTLWAEGFKKFYPNVKIEVEGKGSSTAPPALIGGTASLGPMSRPMKADEIDAFEKKFGYKPTEIKVSIDALAVFVHKDNPLTGVTLDQLDGIFGAMNFAAITTLTAPPRIALEPQKKTFSNSVSTPHVPACSRVSAKGPSVVSTLPSRTRTVVAVRVGCRASPALKWPVRMMSCVNST